MNNNQAIKKADVLIRQAGVLINGPRPHRAGNKLCEAANLLASLNEARLDASSEETKSHVASLSLDAFEMTQKLERLHERKNRRNGYHHRKAGHNQKRIS